MRLLSVGYKTRLSDWGGYTLSLQDLSSHVLPRLLAAGVGSRPVVFVTHSLGGLVVKQMLQDAADEQRCGPFSHYLAQGHTAAETPLVVGLNSLAPTPSHGCSSG